MKNKLIMLWYWLALSPYGYWIAFGAAAGILLALLT